MTFASILSERPGATYEPDAPAFFRDLNLDQICADMVKGKEEYDLVPFFNTPLTTVDAIEYRHEVFRDLENSVLLEQIGTFAAHMQSMRSQLARLNKLYYSLHQQGSFLDAIDFYCKAIAEFSSAISAVQLDSRGLRSFRTYLANYAAGSYFASLYTEMKEIKNALAEIRYCVLIDGNTFTVRNYDGQPDYSQQVDETFERFKQGAVKDYRVTFRESEDMNHIEAKILEFVSLLNPEIFSRLGGYCKRNKNFIDQTIAAFDREIQFYVSYLNYIEPLKTLSLPFCQPGISDQAKKIFNHGGFDLALARKLANENIAVVSNDFELQDRERIIVVSGPNQGGKTTFARAFGQIHYLASLGVPVPGRQAQLFLYDRILTHFEREERVESHRGKLQDDLVRIHDLLAQATGRSILIMNEIFTSTTLHDETFLSHKIMTSVANLDMLCVWVTFVDELARDNEKTVSMVSTVEPDDPAARTFKVIRQRADGLAYAMAIAEKYRLTYKGIMKRVPA